MPKYEAPSSAPENFKEFQAWVLDELRHLSDALSQLETDAISLKEWNAEPDKLYEGLVAFADGSNWNPGDGAGVYAYVDGAWSKMSAISRTMVWNIQPGASPGTNINTTDLTSSRGHNGITPANAVNLAKSGSSGDWRLDASGALLAFNPAETILAITSVSIVLHDLNSSSGSEIYFIDGNLAAGHIDFRVSLSGTVVNLDWTTILDAGDTVRLVVGFLTAK